jgi:hypothetical protein
MKEMFQVKNMSPFVVSKCEGLTASTAAVAVSNEPEPVFAAAFIKPKTVSAASNEIENVFAAFIKPQVGPGVPLTADPSRFSQVQISFKNFFCLFWLKVLIDHAFLNCLTRLINCSFS